MIEDIKKHALECYPRECCGVVIVFKGREKYIPCRNIATDPKQFLIDPEDYYKAADKGEIIKIVHSHCNKTPELTQADMVDFNEGTIPWLIISVPTMEIKEFIPTGEKVPLFGRQFTHGILDCYTFIRDYYQQILNIELPDFERRDNWWHADDNLYVNNFEKAGFRRVDELQEHDVILMQVASRVPNHGAVFDGNNNIHHHQVSRLSSTDVYGEFYRKITTHYLRHKDL